MRDYFVPPVIEYFEIERAVILRGMPVNLSWKVLGSDSVFINQGVGEVIPEDSIVVTPESSCSFALTAENAFGKTKSKQNVKTYVAPKMSTLEIPIPKISSQIGLDKINISSPKIDLSIQIINPVAIKTDKKEYQDISEEIHSDNEVQIQKKNISLIYEFLSGKISGIKRNIKKS
jgi:hypothetical protein